MEPRITSKELQQIHEQAALWMLLKEEGPLSCAKLRRFDAWLKLPYRAEALRKMEALNNHVELPWRRRRLTMRLDPWNNPPLTSPS
jgi:ferric-dicitrate binding protein FerR (iron transport regulator)